MRYTLKWILVLITVLFSHFSFAGCGSAKMNQAVKQLLSEARTTYGVPGIQLSILCPGENTPHDFVSGYADVKKALPMRPNHLFQVGSETKPFVAAVMLQLESEGKLSIHDPIGNYLDDIPALWQSVSVEQILNHTSGIPDYIASSQFLSILKSTNGSKQWTYEELIASVRDQELDFQPGRGWNYSQTNYVLAGKIIETITQNSLASELNYRILMPLHLENTLYAPYAYDDELLKRMAHGYSASGFFPEKSRDITDYNISWLNAAGSMLSTTHDKAIWLKALLQTNILPPLQKHELKQLVDIKTGRLLPASSPSYGYGTGIIGWYTSSFGPLWGGLGKTLGYYSGTFYLACNDIVISTAFNHFSQAESESAGVRLFLFKALSTIQSFETKRCSNLKVDSKIGIFPYAFEMLDAEGDLLKS